MTWGPGLRAELAELFAEEYQRGKPQRLRWEHLGMREGWLQGEGFGLTKRELRLLEVITVEGQLSRAGRRIAMTTREIASTRARFVKLGLIQAWRAPRAAGRTGARMVWFAEVTQRGWRVLLGKEKARRVRAG